MAASDLVIDGFTNREFSVDELTQVMNVMPNDYGLVSQLGIFPAPLPLSTTSVGVEIQNWTLNLLPATARGAPGTRGSVGKRSRKLFEIPQITHEDAVTVSDVQNLRAFGSFAPKMLEDLVREKLFTMVKKHALTHEWYRINALQGKLLDSDGTEMYNFFDEFGITQAVGAFSGANIPAKLRAIKRHIEDNLKGETMTGVICLASKQFMEMLFADTVVLAAYNQAMAAHQALVAVNPTLQDRRFSFVLQEIQFIEYTGSAASANADGTYTTRKFIPDGDALFFPLGTMESARQWVAPGDFEEAVNMPGQLFYAKEARDKWGRSREMLTQSNLLVMWQRPALLVRGTTGGSGDTVG